MYDDRAIPKVIDFGVAKATGQALTDADVVTGFGALIGTPEYMSPEQAGFNNLDIDTRTDVYSLGVLLYELLSGHTPVDRRSLQKAAVYEILRIVRDVDAPLLSAKLSSIDTLPSVAANRRTEPKKLAMQFRGELDWVLHKALEKDRQRRYATANGLASDIQRYLANEIVEARPPSTLYTLQKLFKRNKGQVLAAGLVLLSLLAGIVGTTWGLLRAEERRVQAEAAQAREAQQRGLAEANEARAVLAKEQEAQQRAIAESERQRAIESRNRALEALRATTGEDVEKLIGAKKVLSENERAYLEAIAKRWQVFAAEVEADELSRQISAEGHLRVADLWDQLGRREDALREYEQAQKTYRELASEFPNVADYTDGLATSCNNLGLALDHLGRGAEAQARLREGLAINLKLTNEFPDRAEYRLSLAGNYHNLAIVSDALGDKAAALESYRQGLSIEEKLARDFPDQPEYRSRLAMSQSNLGVLFVSMGNHEEARVHYDQALAAREKLAAEFPKQTEYFVDLASSYNNDGNLLVSLGQSDEAVKRYRQAIAIKEKVVADFPGMPEYSNSLASGYNNLGSRLRSLGKHAEAVAMYRKAMAIHENLASTFPFEPEYLKDLSDTYKNLASLLRTVNEPELALELHVKAIDIREKLVRDFAAIPEYRESLSTSYASLALLLRRQEKLSEAEEAYRKAMAIQEELTAEYPKVASYFDALALTCNGLANLLADRKMLEQALEQYRRAAAIREKLINDHPGIPDYKVDLAAIYGNTGIKLYEADKFAESLEWFQKAIELLGPVHESAAKSEKSTRYLTECYEGRSKALYKLQKYPEAENDWNKYVALNPPEDKYKLLTKRWKKLLRQGLVTEAIQRIAEFTKLPIEAPDDWYEFACSYSLAADRLPEKQMEYADRAMELLKQAVKTGYDNAKRMNSDSDLKSLRDRDDFKTLVSEVESKAISTQPASPVPE